MRRRKIIALLGCAAVAWPLEAYAQRTGKVWRIGLFHVGLDHVPPSLPTLKEELARLGYIEGMNTVLDWRNQESEETARVVAQEWVASGYDLIVAFEDQCIRVAKEATSTIPIVFVHPFDPITAGYIKSLSRPGGNITGPVSHVNFLGKQLELFNEVSPRLRRVLVLGDHRDPFTPSQLKIARRATAELGIELVERDTPTQVELEQVFAELAPGEIDGVVIASPYVMTNLTGSILALARRAHVPVVTHRKGWTENGALFSYATDFAAVGSRAAHYIDKIFKGAEPGELPAEEVSRIELVVNLKAAAVLGLTISPSLLARADEVIE